MGVFSSMSVKLAISKGNYVNFHFTFKCHVATRRKFQKYMLRSIPRRQRKASYFMLLKTLADEAWWIVSLNQPHDKCCVKQCMELLLLSSFYDTHSKHEYVRALSEPVQGIK